MRSAACPGGEAASVPELAIGMCLSFKLEFAWDLVDEPSGGVHGRYGGGLATRWEEIYSPRLVKGQVCHDRTDLWLD